MQIKTAVRWIAALSLVALGPLASALHAMRVSPMVVEMLTSGPRANARIEVQNVMSGVLAYETHITRLEYDEKGNQSEVPADDDFLVFPPQGTLPANARQVIRLQWLGGEDIPASRSYYLSVNQLPVALGADAKNTGQVQIVYHMKALITVAPPGAKPVIEVLSATPSMIQPKSAPGQPVPPKIAGLVVKLRNSGNRYAMVAGARWIVDGMGPDKQPVHVELSQEDLSRMIGVGYVPPLSGVRTFEIPFDKPMAPESVKIRFAQ